MAVCCSSLTSWFSGILLTYFLNDFEMVPVAPIITEIIIIIIIRKNNPNADPSSVTLLMTYDVDVVVLCIVFSYIHK
jgi:hypothetical protein